MPAVKGRFGEVIAERTLVSVHGDTVIVSLGRPRPSGFELEWECPFRIKGAGLETIKFGRGVDAMQALVMALEGIRYVLDRTDLVLTWKDAMPDHTGFQRAIPVLFGAAFAARLERLVDQEIARYVRTLKARRKRRVAKRKN